MSLDRWMDKEDVVHIYNGILLSHKKKRNGVVCRDMDGPRVCHTEWSKSEREKQILYINADMWNLEKWYSWTYFQGRNRNADVENGRVDMGERGGWDELGDDAWHIYTTVCKTDSWWEPAAQHRELSSMLCDDLDGHDGREVQEGGDNGICVYVWLIHFTVQQKLTQHCRAIILQ